MFPRPSSPERARDISAMLRSRMTSGARMNANSEAWGEFQELCALRVMWFLGDGFLVDRKELIL